LNYVESDDWSLVMIRRAVVRCGVRVSGWWCICLLSMSASVGRCQHRLLFVMILTVCYCRWFIITTLCYWRWSYVGLGLFFHRFITYHSIVFMGFGTGGSGPLTSFKVGAWAPSLLH